MSKKDETTKAKDLEAEVKKLTTALQIERADAMNLRRRHDEDLRLLSGRVKANIVRELLPAIDNLERSLKHVPKDLEKNHYVIGVKAVVKQFDKALSDIGVEKIKTVGEPFNPSLHEAVAVDGGNGTREIVSAELQSGYNLGGEVIRHAMVKVRMQ